MFDFIDVGMASSGDVFDNGGTLEYTPYPGATGSDSFEYTLIDDMTGAAASAMVYITINEAPNIAPIAVDDAITMNEMEGSILIDVLANDSDPDAFMWAGITLVSVELPANGYATIIGDQIEYTAPFDGTTTETFTYTIQDDDGELATASVTVTIENSAGGLVAVDDYITVNENESVTINFLNNDTGGFNIIDIGMPNNGEVIDLGGTLEYTPYPGATGEDSFEYTLIDDMTGAFATATIFITIEGNSANGPIAVDDTVTTTEDQTITILVLTNDSDPNDSYLTLIDVTTASMGDVTLDPTLNTLVYTPWPNQTGSDSFEYTITNDLGLTATATVIVTVETVNTPPVFEELVEFDTGEIEVAAEDNIFEDGMIVVDPKNWTGC